MNMSRVLLDTVNAEAVDNEAVDNNIVDMPYMAVVVVVAAVDNLRAMVEVVVALCLHTPVVELVRQMV